MPAEWAFLATYGTLALFCTVYSYINIPLLEFGNFKVGTNIAMKMDELTDTDNFETVFVYEKDGVRKHFSLDSLPGTDWNYVDRETVYLGNEEDLLFDMTLEDSDGVMVTEDIVDSDSPVFIFSAFRPEDLDGRYWKKVAECVDSAEVYDAGCYVAVPVMSSVVDSIAMHFPGLARTFVTGDYRTLISMVRSNGGVMLMDDGMVVRKWSGWRFDPKDVARTVSMDSEEITARGTISRRLFCESSILILFLIIIVFRYVCGIVYGKRYSSRKHHVQS